MNISDSKCATQYAQGGVLACAHKSDANPGKRHHTLCFSLMQARCRGPVQPIRDLSGGQALMRRLTSFLLAPSRSQLSSSSASFPTCTHNPNFTEPDQQHNFGEPEEQRTNRNGQDDPSQKLCNVAQPRMRHTRQRKWLASPLDCFSESLVPGIHVSGKSSQ